MEENYTKLKAVKKEDFTEVQEYFNDKSVKKRCMVFIKRCQMVPEIPANFKEKEEKRRVFPVVAY